MIDYSALGEEELKEYANFVLVSGEVLNGSMMPRCGITQKCSLEKLNVQADDDWKCNDCQRPRGGESNKHCFHCRLD